MQMIEYLEDRNAPPPVGHYSQATLAGGLLFISGQLPIEPLAASDRSPMEIPFREQARRAISNMLTIVKGAGGSEATLAKVTVYIVGAANWADFDQVYAELLGAARPARSVVPVPELHLGYLVEVDAVAVLGNG